MKNQSVIVENPDGLGGVENVKVCSVVVVNEPEDDCRIDVVVVEDGEEI